MTEPMDPMDVYGFRVGQELHTLSDAAVRPFDASAIVRDAVGGHARVSGAALWFRTGERSRLGWWLILAALMAVLLWATGLLVGSRLLAPQVTLDAPPGPGAFVPTGPMTEARWGHTLTVLQDGSVLAIGGEDSGMVSARVERWDPTTGTFELVAALPIGRTGHTATPLPDGRVLVIGGHDSGYERGDESIASQALLWDPTAGRFEVAGLQTRRVGHTATFMPDGRVLIVGGWSPDPDGSHLLDTTEWWDPDLKDFVQGPSLDTARSDHTATLLPDGRLLVAGGYDGYSGELFDSVGILEPGDAAFHAASPLGTRRYGHTATLLQDGSVLVVGGGNEAGYPQESGIASAELWDPDSETFSSTGAPSLGRAMHTSTLLLDGRVLVVGGSDSESSPSFIEGVTTAELWDPLTGTFGLATPTAHEYAGHGAALLPDGRVLVAGAYVASRFSICGGEEIPADQPCGRPIRGERVTYAATAELFLPDGAAKP